MSGAHAIPGAAHQRDPAMPWWFERCYVWLVQLVNVVFRGPDRIAQPLSATDRAIAAEQPPILLVYGMGCTGRTWDSWRRSLVEDGFRVHVVDLPRNGMGSARVAARALAAAVEDIRREHGCERVQLVGFSFGGIVSRTFLQLMDGWRHVDRLVTVATPHHGSRLAPCARRLERSPIARRMNESTRELAPDSALMSELAERWGPEDAARCTSIYAPAFELVSTGVV